MSIIGILCPPLPSHIRCMGTLGRELIKRNHRVILFGILDVETHVNAEGLEFIPIGTSDHPIGSLTHYHSQMQKLSGLNAMKFVFQTVQTANLMMCRDAPEALTKANIDILLADQGEPIGGSIADFLNLPFITIINGLPINREPNLPPFFTPWNYQPNVWARLRNFGGYKLFDGLTRSIAKGITHQRQQWHLPAYQHPDDAFSKLAQLCQLPIEFDFPRTKLPDCFQFTGPFGPQRSQNIEFPYSQLTDKPLIYASLGTVLGSRLDIFHKIAQACEPLDAQLVITLGHSGKKLGNINLPGTPLIVDFAPQLELLKRATLTLTHAGLNTALESLSVGVPMVAIPITNDQPGVAARLAWSGSGTTISANNLTIKKLRTKIVQVLTDPSFRKQAMTMKQSIQKSGGVVKAADVIEQVIKTQKPVLSNRKTASNQINRTALKYSPTCQGNIT